MCVALASSLRDQVVPQHYCFAAEVGLGGEIRGVSRVEQRIAEAAKLGFKKLFISPYNLRGLTSPNLKLDIRPMARIDALLISLFV